MSNMSKMLDMSQMSRDVEICRQYVQIHTNMMGYVTNVKGVGYVANMCQHVEICRQYVQIYTNMIGYVTNAKHVKDVRYVANVERC